jgi:MoxR-like ATPase
VRELRTAVQHVYIDEILRRWIVDLVRATRDLDSVAMGASVRGSLALERAARAWALLHGRGHVVPEDIERLFVPVILHRLVFTSGFLARARAASADEAIEEFRRACLEVAPMPGSAEDPLFERPRPVP